MTVKQVMETNKIVKENREVLGEDLVRRYEEMRDFITDVITWKVEVEDTSNVDRAIEMLGEIRAEILRVIL